MLKSRSFRSVRVVGIFLLIGTLALVAAPRIPAIRGAMAAMVRQPVRIRGLAITTGSALLPGDAVTIGNGGTLQLAMGGGEVWLGANSRATLEAPRRFRLNSGLAEVAGTIAIRSGNWIVTPQTADTQFTVATPGHDVYVKVVRGEARLRKAGGHGLTLGAGQSKQVARQAESPTTSHALRNHLITAAIVGTPVAAFTAYKLTHQVVQTTGPCMNCITSPSQ